MVTITRHLFNNFFQMKHFSAMEFYMGYEKNMSFLVIPKSLTVGKKELKRSDWAAVKTLILPCSHYAKGAEKVSESS